MNVQWADPERSQQLFENALVATTWALIGLAALVGALCLIFIIGECFRLLDKRGTKRGRAANVAASARGIQQGAAAFDERA